MAPIVLMTDFGVQDSYVGVMKGVIAGIAPSVPTIDLTHEIRPQDIQHAAYTLAIAVPYFPAGSIFCVVVDPGVGSSRRAIAVQAGDWRFVLPDNGILGRLLARWPAREAVALTNPHYRLPSPSMTFHGRDIFAPAAAHLAAGVPLAELGDPLPVEALHRIDMPRPHQEGQRWIGHIQHIDRFGNLITTLSEKQLQHDRDWQLSIEGQAAPLSPIRATFADVPEGAPVAYIGSDGFLELAIRNGNAAEQWQVTPGERVIATRESGPGRVPQIGG